jgi:release factor glutamine methyltransferase
MKNNPVCVGDWLASARQFLQNGRSAPDGQNAAGLETQVLLAHAIQKPRAWLLAHPQAEIPPHLIAGLNANLNRLVSGTPLPYLTGHQEFYGLDFTVTPDVLIPRPETELLVEHALRWIAQRPGALRAADVGTGSGCIAVSIAHHARNVRMVAVDRSWRALRAAVTNVNRHGLAAQISLLIGDLLSAVAGPFDLVCANLPYIPSAALSQLEVTRHEPILALDGGTDGLVWIKALLADSARWLAPGGLMLLEIEAGQGESAARLANSLCARAEVRVIPDLSGRSRLLSVARKEKA